MNALSQDELARIDALFITDLSTLRTPWNELKADAANPTLSHLRDLVEGIVAVGQKRLTA